MSSQKIRLIAVIICALIITAVGGLLIWRLQIYRQAQHELALRNQELTMVQNEINEMTASIEKYKQEQVDFEQYLFAERDVPAFLEGVSEFAKQTNVNVVDMQTRSFQVVQVDSGMDGRPALAQKIQSKKMEEQKTAEDVITLAAMPIDIQIEGTYKAFIDFLNNLESFKQLLTISNVSLSTTQNYPTLSARFTLKIYSFKNLADIQTP